MRTLTSHFSRDSRGTKSKNKIVLDNKECSTDLRHLRQFCCRCTLLFTFISFSWMHVLHSCMSCSLDQVLCSVQFTDCFSRCNLIVFVETMSQSSVESFVDNIENDPDFVYNLETNSNQSNTSDDTTDGTIDFVNFNKWDDVSLEPIAKRKIKSEVWNFYGTLKKGNRIFPPTSEKYFCRLCFDNHKFKRYFFLFCASTHSLTFAAWLFFVFRF